MADPDDKNLFWVFNYEMELLKKQWMEKAELDRQGLLVWNECNKTLCVEGMGNIS